MIKRTTVIYPYKKNILWIDTRGYIAIDKNKTSIEVIRLFLLNTLPKELDARYVFIDDYNWNDTYFWID